MNHRFALVRARRGRVGRGGRPFINLVSLMDIFTILVFFLLVNAGEVERLPAGTGVRLPPSEAERSPPPAPALTVDGEGVRFQGRLLAKVDPRHPRRLVQTLVEALRPRAEALARSGVLVLGDRDVPFAVVRAVLDACAQAGVTQVHLAVEGPHG